MEFMCSWGRWAIHKYNDSFKYYKEKSGREETGGEEERKVVREGGLGLKSGTRSALGKLRLQLCGSELDQSVSRIRQLWKGWKCHWWLYAGRTTSKDCLVFLGSQAGRGEGREVFQQEVLLKKWHFKEQTCHDVTQNRGGKNGAGNWERKLKESSGTDSTKVPLGMVMLGYDGRPTSSPPLMFLLLASRHSLSGRSPQDPHSGARPSSTR